MALYQLLPTASPTEGWSVEPVGSDHWSVVDELIADVDTSDYIQHTSPPGGGSTAIDIFSFSMPNTIISASQIIIKMSTGKVTPQPNALTLTPILSWTGGSDTTTFDIAADDGEKQFTINRNFTQTELASLSLELQTYAEEGGSPAIIRVYAIEMDVTALIASESPPTVSFPDAQNFNRKLIQISDANLHPSTTSIEWEIALDDTEDLYSVIYTTDSEGIIGDYYKVLDAGLSYIDISLDASVDYKVRSKQIGSGDENWTEWVRVPIRGSNFEMQYRGSVAPELYGATQTDAAYSWTEWKRLFYHWRLNRNLGGRNDIFFVTDPDLYFEEPGTESIID